VRPDGRANHSLRPVTIETGYLDTAEGSALISFGRTLVLCTASVEERVPEWLAGRGKGWVTGEYGMLPRSTPTRRDRERGAVSGRTREIQRFIGRALRASVDLERLGERTVIVDCDVLRADGGTRTAAVTGGYVALASALACLAEDGCIPVETLKVPVAAVSVGMVDGQPLLDLCYAEDVRADVDMNVVMTAVGEYVEVQGTAEGTAFSRGHLDRLLDLAWQGIQQLVGLQREALA